MERDEEGPSERESERVRGINRREEERSKLPIQCSYVMGARTRYSQPFDDKL